MYISIVKEKTRKGSKKKERERNRLNGNVDFLTRNFKYRMYSAELYYCFKQCNTTCV